MIFRNVSNCDFSVVVKFEKDKGFHFRFTALSIEGIHNTKGFEKAGVLS